MPSGENMDPHEQLAEYNRKLNKGPTEYSRQHTGTTCGQYGATREATYRYMREKRRREEDRWARLPTHGRNDEKKGGLAEECFRTEKTTHRPKIAHIRDLEWEKEETQGRENLEIFRKTAEPPR